MEKIYIKIHEVVKFLAFSSVDMRRFRFTISWTKTFWTEMEVPHAYFSVILDLWVLDSFVTAMRLLEFFLKQEDHTMVKTFEKSYSLQRLVIRLNLKEKSEMNQSVTSFIDTNRYLSRIFKHQRKYTNRHFLLVFHLHSFAFRVAKSCPSLAWIGSLWMICLVSNLSYINSLISSSEFLILCGLFALCPWVLRCSRCTDSSKSLSKRWKCI